MTALSPAPAAPRRGSLILALLHPRRLGWKGCVQLLGALICAVLVTVFLQEAIRASIAPSDYPFGGEGPVAGLWRYLSQQHYVFAALAHGVVLLAAFLYLIFSRASGLPLVWTLAVLSFYVMVAPSLLLPLLYQALGKPDVPQLIGTFAFMKATG